MPFTVSPHEADHRSSRASRLGGHPAPGLAQFKTKYPLILFRPYSLSLLLIASLAPLGSISKILSTLLGWVIITSIIIFTNLNSASAVSLSSFRSISPGCTELFPITLTESSAFWILIGNPFFTRRPISSLRSFPVSPRWIISF